MHLRFANGRGKRQVHLFVAEPQSLLGERLLLLAGRHLGELLRNQQRRLVDQGCLLDGRQGFQRLRSGRALPRADQRVNRRAQQERENDGHRALLRFHGVPIVICQTPYTREKRRAPSYYPLGPASAHLAKRNLPRKVGHRTLGKEGSCRKRASPIPFSSCWSWWPLCNRRITRRAFQKHWGRILARAALSTHGKAKWRFSPPC